MKPKRVNLFHCSPLPQIYLKGKFQDTQIPSVGFSHGQVCKHLAAVNSVLRSPQPSSAQMHLLPHPQLPRSTLQLTLPPGGLFARPVWRKDSARERIYAQPSLPIPAFWPRLLQSPWPRPLPGALWPTKKSRPDRCTPPRAFVRRPRLAKESAAILFFSWFQWGEKEETGSGAVLPPPLSLCPRRGKGGVNHGRELVAALRECRRWEGDGRYRYTQH